MNKNELKFILLQGLGSGMKRMEEYCRKENAPSPEVEFTNNYFYIVFRPSKANLETAKKTREGLVEGLVESPKKILSLISESPKISKRELAKKIGISTTTIDKNIVKLKRKGLLKRIGAAKGGYWKVTRKWRVKGD